MHFGLADEAETIDKLVSEMRIGATYLALKMQRAAKMYDNWLHFDQLSKGYGLVELLLKIGTLTKKEAAEKAREIALVEDNLRTSATTYYNTIASPEQDTGLRMVHGPQTPTRQTTLSWVAIVNGIIAADPRNVTSFLAGPID